MPKKTNKTSISAATHRLTLEIAKSHPAVWEGFTRGVHLWWPKDFYATESPKRIVFEVKPGGRLYEDAGDGNGLVWYSVIAVDAPNAITLSGFHRTAIRRSGYVTPSRGLFSAGQVGHDHGGDRFHVRLPGRREHDRRRLAHAFRGRLQGLDREKTLRGRW